MHLGVRWRELIMTHPEAHNTDLHLSLTTEEAVIECKKLPVLTVKIRKFQYETACDWK